MFSNNVTNVILNSLTGRADKFGSHVYIGLSSTPPTAEGGNITEPTDSSYRRILLGQHNTPATWMMGDPVDGVIQNAREIHFNASTKAWDADCTHAVLFTAETGGDFLASGALQTALHVDAANIVPTIVVGELKITIAEAQ